MAARGFASVGVGGGCYLGVVGGCVSGGRGGAWSGGGRRRGGRRGRGCIPSICRCISTALKTGKMREGLQAPTASNQAQMRGFKLRQRGLQRASRDDHPAYALSDVLVCADKVPEPRFPTPELVLLFANHEMDCLAFIKVFVHHAPHFQWQLREEGRLPLEVCARVELRVRDRGQTDC